MIYVHVIEHCSLSKPWIAHIVGASERFGFERKFVRPRRDWRKSSKRMSGRTDGIRSCYLLEDGWLCEVFEQSSPHQKRTPRYFAVVETDGLRRLSEEAAIEWLRNPC